MSFFLTDWIAHPSHLPLVGSLFGTTPEQEKLQQQIAGLQQIYQQYRPEAAQARMNGLNNQLDLFSPVNSLLSQINGQGGGGLYNLDVLRRNPLPDQALQVGNAAPSQGSGLPGPASALLKTIYGK